jgi:heme/copper-type cytochrome/quinol oxidase subunit 2
MDVDMIGFRIIDAADKGPDLQCKRRFPAGAKALLATVPLLLSMIVGCRKTPTYTGPPNLVMTVVMKKWEIVPSRIVLPQGAHVELIVHSADVEHGFNVPALAINEPVRQSKPAIVRFLAEKPGTYLMRCSIACGKGHDRMTGSIVILPPTSRQMGP